jgi:ribosomal protein S27AE
VAVDTDRAPICPACGTTMLLSDDDERKYVCAECEFSDDDEPS